MAVRGQGGMESLMTYAWAIFAVFVIGILIWQLGFFDMGKSTVTATDFEKIKPQLSVTGLTSDGVFSSVFLNGVGTDIVVTGVVIKHVNNLSVLCCSSSHLAPDGIVCTHSASDIAGVDADGFPLNYPPDYDTDPLDAIAKRGSNFNMELGRTAGHSPPGNAADSCQIGGAEKGDVYNLEVSIYYDMELDNSRISQKEVGRIRGIIE